MADETFIGKRKRPAAAPPRFPCPFCGALVVCWDENAWIGHDESAPYPVWCDSCEIAALTHREGRTRSLRKPTNEEIEMWKVSDPAVYAEFKWEFVDARA